MTKTRKASKTRNALKTRLIFPMRRNLSFYIFIIEFKGKAISFISKACGLFNF